MIIFKRMILGIMVITASGCAGIQDIPRTLWGSSTRALEKARSNALTKTYDKGYWDCMRATITFLENKGYTIFRKDEVNGVLVVMGISGAVNTTEVGIFFVEVNEQQTRLELSSLSTHAKRLLAKPLFHGLDIAFGLVPPDPEDLTDVSQKDKVTVDKI